MWNSSKSQRSGLKTGVSVRRRSKGVGESTGFLFFRWNTSTLPSVPSPRPTPGHGTLRALIYLGKVSERLGKWVPEKTRRGHERLIFIVRHYKESPRVSRCPFRRSLPRPPSPPVIDFIFLITRSRPEDSEVSRPW